MAVLHRNADGLCGIDSVAIQRRVAIDGARNGEPNAVVHGRDGIDFNVVDDVFHAGRCGDDCESGVTVGIVVGGTTQSDDAVVHVKGNGVEHVAVSDGAVRNLLQQLLLPHAVGDAGSRNLNIGANRGDAFNFVDRLVGVSLVLVVGDGAG